MAVCTGGEGVSKVPRVQPGSIAVVSHTVPGGCNGQAVMLQRLGETAATAGHPPGLLFIDTDRKARRRTELPGGLPVQAVRTPWALRKLSRFHGTHRWLFPRLVQHRARRIAAIVRRQQSAAIVGCTGGDLVDLPAAIEAGRLVGVPVFLYYFDDYAIQRQVFKRIWSPETMSYLGDIVEPEVLRQATGVIVPNETLAEDVRQRTDTPTIVVRNPVDIGRYSRLRHQFPNSQADRNRPLRIVYTGSVYAAQADSIQRCCQAITAAAARGVQAALHIYGPPPDQEIQGSLKESPIAWHPPTTQHESAVVQVQADMLFLPLSFNCSYPELIRSSAPGKFGEYLASGTPVIIHAPADSFPVSFAKRHGCAAICSTPEVESLTETICTLADDAAVCDRLSNAAITAAADFCQQRNSRRFVEFVMSVVREKRDAALRLAGVQLE